MDNQNTDELVENIVNEAKNTQARLSELSGYIAEADAVSATCLDFINCASESASCEAAERIQELIEDLKKAAKLDYNRI